MKIHEIFPILIAQDKVDNHDEFKENYYDDLQSLWWNGYENTTPEHSERTSLHLKPEFNSIFESIGRSVRRYLELMEVNHQIFYVNITKSWIGYADSHTPPLTLHLHNDSDISFCYYISCDSTSDKFCLHNYNNMNEISGQLFEVNKKHNTIKKFNKYNCDRYTISAQEGTILIFPSQLQHSTLKKENLEDRYCLIGDIKLCLKPEHNIHHQSCPHPSLWLEL